VTLGGTSERRLAPLCGLGLAWVWSMRLHRSSSGASRYDHPLSTLSPTLWRSPRPWQQAQACLRVGSWKSISLGAPTKHKPGARPLAIVYCMLAVVQLWLLAIVYWLLSIGYCLKLSSYGYWLLSIVYWLLSIGYCPAMAIGYCLLAILRSCCTFATAPLCWWKYPP
jgi:hypothetical protein